MKNTHHGSAKVKMSVLHLNLIYVPQIHTEHSKQSIKYRGPTVWNDT